MRTNHLIVIALYLLVSAGMTLLTSSLRFDRDARSCLAAMLDGTAHRPFVMRRLVPDTLGMLTRWTPIAWQKSVVKATEALPPPLPAWLLGRTPQAAYAHLLLVISVWACYFGMLLCWRMLLRAYLGLPTLHALWLPVLGLGLVYPLLNWRHGVHLYDPATLLLYSLALWALLRQKWWLYGLIFALATWHKETALLLIFWWLIAMVFALPPTGSPHSRGEPQGAGKGTAMRYKNAGSQENFFLTRGMESPLTPLTKGGEGREWGDSACEKPPPRAPNECGWWTLIRPKGGGGGNLKARAVGALAMGLFYLAVRLWLGWRYRQNEGSLLEFWLLKENLPLLMSLFTEFGWRQVRFLLILTVAIGLPAWGWRTKPLLLRRMLLMGLVLFSPLWLLFGILDEFRALLELYPLWLMLCVPAGYSLPSSTATAPSGMVSRS
jgi:hypothetical protein